MDKQRQSDAKTVVKSFSELLNVSSSLLPGEQQQLAAALFPSVVARSHMKMWAPGEAFPQKGNRLLIGVAASYSNPDLKLLDALEAKLSLGTGQDDHTDLFDVDACRDITDFEKY